MCECLLLSVPAALVCKCPREHCILKLVNKWRCDHCRVGQASSEFMTPSLCRRKKGPLQVTQTHTDTGIHVGEEREELSGKGRERD